MSGFPIPETLAGWAGVNWVLHWLLLGTLAYGWWSCRRQLRPRSSCRDDIVGHCKAFAWPHCSDGRCRYHCTMRCQCVPRAEPGDLRVIDGSKR